MLLSIHLSILKVCIVIKIRGMDDEMVSRYNSRRFPKLQDFNIERKNLDSALGKKCNDLLPIQ